MMAIIVTFSIFGVLFGLISIMFISCGADKRQKIKCVLFCIALWLVFSSLMCLDAYIDFKAWNDGKCDCGGKWELTAVSESRTGTKTKYYVCEKCGHEIEQ